MFKDVKAGVVPIPPCKSLKVLRLQKAFKDCCPVLYMNIYIKVNIYIKEALPGRRQNRQVRIQANCVPTELDT